MHTHKHVSMALNATQVGSRLGKSFLDNLDANEKHPSIVREASRVCANLWAEDPCPEVGWTDCDELHKC